MAEAMAELRRECGDDAIIVSTEETATGVKVVVALEEPDDDVPGVGAVTSDPVAALSADDPIDVVHEALLAHGIPNRLLERLVDASFLVGSDDPTEALTGAFRQVFTFHSFANRRSKQPLMLIGAPGSGKTLTVAKLAARAVFAKRKTRLITTDTIRAGGIEQLHAFARLMKLPMQTAESEDQLVRLVSMSAADETVIIDAPGINPYSARDMMELAGYIKAVNAEPVLVMAAGGDVVDSMDQAQEFAKLGATRMIVTRLDMVRRLGGMLAAADAARLPFSEYSSTADVVDGLSTFDPRHLARMLLPHLNADTIASTSMFHSANQGSRS